MPGPDFSIRLGLVGTAQVITGLQSMIQIVGQVVGKVRELAEAADQYGDVVAGHRVSVDQAREATNGLVSSMTLHQQAARLEAAGVELTSDQLRSLAVAATNYANTAGEDIDESFVRLTESVQRASSRGLRPYGIELQGTGTTAQRQQRILEQLTSRFGDQTVEIEGTADAMGSLANEWDRAWNEMLQAVERNAGPLQTIIRGISGAVTDLANALESQRRAQEHLARMGTEARQHEIEQRLSGMGIDMTRSNRNQITYNSGGQQAGFLEMVAGAATLAWDDAWQGEFGEAVLDITEAGARIPAEARQLIAEYDRLARQDIEDISTGAQPVVREQEIAYQPTDTDDRGGGGGGRRARARSGWEAFGPNSDDPADQLSAEWDEEQIERRLAREREFIQLSIDAEQMMNDKRQELHEQELERQELQREASERTMAARIEAAEKAATAEQEAHERTAQRIADAEGVTKQYIGVIGDLAGAVLEAAVGEKQAADISAKIKGGLIIAESAVGIVLAGAKMAMAIGEENYVAVAAYVAAIAGYAATIVKAGTELGNDGRSSGSGGSGAAAGSRRGTPQGNRYSKAGSEQQPIVVNLNGPVTSRRVHDELRQMERDSSR